MGMQPEFRITGISIGFRQSGKIPNLESGSVIRYNPESSENMDPVHPEVEVLDNVVNDYVILINLLFEQ